MSRVFSKFLYLFAVGVKVFAVLGRIGYNKRGGGRRMRLVYRKEELARKAGKTIILMNDLFFDTDTVLKIQISPLLF